MYRFILSTYVIVELTLSTLVVIGVVVCCSVGVGWVWLRLKLFRRSWVGRAKPIILLDQYFHRKARIMVGPTVLLYSRTSVPLGTCRWVRRGKLKELKKFGSSCACDEESDNTFAAKPGRS